MFDIDIVVLWVDGNDQQWQQEKNEFLNRTGLRANDTNNRYRDWGLMKYWFRAVEKYTPWIRKIHFVTCGHIPEFLNTDNEKVHIVKHKDFMPADSLPTYSSKALELNIHRIEGLAEHFIYMNDDLFFNRPLKKDDFFDQKTGLPKMFFTEMPIRSTGINPWSFDDVANTGMINKNFSKKDIKLKDYIGKYINRKYGLKDNIRSAALKVLFPEYYTGIKCMHGSAPFLKSTLEEVWEKEPEVLNTVTGHHFRVDGEPNQWLFQYWHIASGKFVPGHRKEILYDVSEENIEEICDCIKIQSADVICINDPEELDNYEKMAKKVVASFEKMLPEKSSFERG